MRSRRSGKDKRNGKEKLGMVSRTFSKEALCLKCSFSRNGVASADRVMKMIMFFSRMLSGLDFKDVDGNGVWPLPDFFRD